MRKINGTLNNHNVFSCVDPCIELLIIPRKMFVENKTSVIQKAHLSSGDLILLMISVANYLIRSLILVLPIKLICNCYGNFL